MNVKEKDEKKLQSEIKQIDALFELEKKQLEQKTKKFSEIYSKWMIVRKMLIEMK